jgi:cytoplasmic iron level regulating protein YaaA (DUF328/UPF0246 family)
VTGDPGVALAGRRTEVTRALAKARGGDAELLGVRGAHLERARRANSGLRGAPGLPAWRRYSGVVWENLDLASLPATTRRRALGAIWVVSALAGFVRADEILPDYRLKMGARLAGLGTLSSWWRPVVTNAVIAAARRGHVVDLLPGEHRSAIDWSALDATGIPVSRIEFRARTGPSGGHFAKAAKGAFARRLCADSAGIPRGDDVAAVVARAVRSFRHGTHVARIVD